MNKKLKKVLTIIGSTLGSLVIIYIAIVFFTYNTQTGKANDSKRLVDIKSIQSGLELYWHDNGKYPNESTIKYDLSSYLYTIFPVDIKEGEVINGCTFGYKYEILDYNNQTYKLSTCLEDKGNIDRFAKNDGGNDDLKYEIGNF